MAHRLRLGLLLLPLFALGCPDTEARYNEFLDATKDQRMSAGEEEDSGSESDSGPPPDLGADGLPDMSGTYLLALETALGPDSPLQFITEVTMTVADDGMSATATVVFTPLSLNVGSTVDPRECLTDAMLTFENVAFDAAGHFTLDMGTVMVTGAANPITGSDITASLVLDGDIRHIDALCGSISGMLMSPLEADLAGSTFGMLRLADDGCTPATLPGFGEFPYKCSQVPPAPSDDTGTGTDTGTDTGSTT